MPTRAMARKLSELLYEHSKSVAYPTRALEFFFAYMMLAWSLHVMLSPEIMTGPAYRQLLMIATPRAYASVGLVTAVFGIVALIRNGNWKRSPGLRAIRCFSSMNWWLVMTIAYFQAVQQGAPDFPMLAVLPVIVLAELHCLIRCLADVFLSYTSRERVTLVGRVGHG